MKVDTDAINTSKVLKIMAGHLNKSKKILTPRKKRLSTDELKAIVKKEIPGLDLENIIKELNKISQAPKILNNKVSLSFNKEINRVIITIIDKSSSRVIREIPCDELQNLALHLKEAVGILYDKIA